MLTTVTADQPPLVSVVMAAFNAARYIAETCQSVLNQTYAHLELIVVDDGSTDNTSDIVAALAGADRRVRLIRQANRGVAAARNTAIAHASGDFIPPLDADDLWLATKLERQVRVLKEQPDAGFVYCWWAWIDSEGHLLDRSPRWMVAGRVFKELVEINFSGNASVPLFRRDALERAGGYDPGLQAEGCQGCEDWSLALRVAADYAIAVVPAVLVGYRRHREGMSRNCNRMWASHQAMCESLEASAMLAPKDRLRSRGQFALHLAGIAFWSRNYRQALGWALRARPVTLPLMVAPHVLVVLARRMTGSLSSPQLRFSGEATVDEGVLPEPLIPYDRIYHRYWRRRRAAVERVNQRS
jgi:glycosyltransferase involved in cell wall biosynthesis